MNDISQDLEKLIACIEISMISAGSTLKKIIVSSKAIKSERRLLHVDSEEKISYNRKIATLSFPTSSARDIFYQELMLNLVTVLGKGIGHESGYTLFPQLALNLSDLNKPPHVYSAQIDYVYPEYSMRKGRSVELIKLIDITRAKSIQTKVERMYSDRIRYFMKQYKIEMEETFFGNFLLLPGSISTGVRSLMHIVNSISPELVLSSLKMEPNYPSKILDDLMKGREYPRKVNAIVYSEEKQIAQLKSQGQIIDVGNRYKIWECDGTKLYLVNLQ